MKARSGTAASAADETTIRLPERFLTVQQVAATLGLGRSTVYDLAKRGELETFEFRAARSSTRGAVRISARSVEDYVARSRRSRAVGFSVP